MKCFRWCPCGWRSWRRRHRHAGRIKERPWTQCVECSWRPLASVVAFLLCSGASLVFGICLCQAVRPLTKLLQLEIVETLVWVVVAGHLLVAACFLLVAVACSGPTRKQMTTTSVFNRFSRCAQIGCICTAYSLHLLWLLLPALLVLPLVAVTGLATLCHLVPDCITLSDYGIPPDVLDDYGPDTIAGALRDFNESVLLDYAAGAERLLLSAIDHLERSPRLEQLLHQAESLVPDAATVDGLVQAVTGSVSPGRLAGLLPGDRAVMGPVSPGRLAGLLPGDAPTGVMALVERLVDLVRGPHDVDAWVDKWGAGIIRGVDIIPGGLPAEVMDGYFGHIRNSSAGVSPSETREAHIWNTSVSVSLSETMAPHIRNTSVSVSLSETRAAHIQNTSANDSPSETVINRLSNQSVKDLEGSFANGNANRTISDVAWVAEEKISEYDGNEPTIVESVVKDLPEHADLALKDLARNTAETIDRVARLPADVQKKANAVIEEAHRVSSDAQQVVLQAISEAEVAMHKAEQLARDSIQEAEANAREFLDTAEKRVEVVARAAHQAASDTLQRAQEALEEADDVIRAVAHGSAFWAQQTVTKARFYIKWAFGWARKAVAEARKVATRVVDYIGLARVKILDMYTVVKGFYYKLNITRIGSDTYCSEVKVAVCEELQLSALCTLLVCLSSILINLSMAHFLMAMAVNYAHLKGQQSKQTPKNSSTEELYPEETNGLTFTTLDTGSIVLTLDTV